MNRTVRRVISGVLVLSLGLLPLRVTAQTLAFDVASIRPAQPINPLAILQGGSMPRVGMTVAGTRVDLGYMTVADIIPIAYDVKPFQVDGSNWLSDQRFDIQARMPEGSTREQVPAMLQALLAERFQLKIHREKREHSIYALVEAKGGHKMKPAEPVKENSDTPAAPNDPNVLNLGNAQVRIEGGAGARGLGTGAFTGGNIATVSSPESGIMRISMTPEGQMRMEFTQVSMPQLADLLTRMVEKPVLDMTDLKGNYQASIGLSLADVLGMARANSATAGLLPPGGFANPFGARGGNSQTPQASDPSTNSVFTSIQQLGLQLDSRKAPVDFIVVDHAEKTPTEN